jgi:hypothetical protein
MRTHNCARPRTAARRAGRAPARDDAPARRHNPRLIADAVIAGYIHDISRGSRHNARAVRARESRLRVVG